jgi:hypothetical protein
LVTAAVDISDPVAWIQYGALGLVVLGFITGWVWPRPSVERLLRDLERQQGQLDSLVKVYQEQVIPVLSRATDHLTRLAETATRNGGP